MPSLNVSPFCGVMMCTRGDFGGSANTGLRIVADRRLSVASTHRLALALERDASDRNLGARGCRAINDGEFPTPLNNRDLVEQWLRVRGFPRNVQYVVGDASRCVADGRRFGRHASFVDYPIAFTQADRRTVGTPWQVREHAKCLHASFDVTGSRLR